MQKRAALIVIILSLTITILTALEAVGHETHSRKDSSRVPDTSHATVIQHEDSENDSPAPVAYVLRPWRALREHLHNKVVHVPIGFSMAAFLLSLLALRREDLDRAIRWLILMAAIGAVVALVTGTNQATMLEGSSKDWVITTHRALGIATLTALWIWTAAWFFLRRRWVAFACGLVVMMLVLATGFFGGILAYG